MILATLIIFALAAILGVILLSYVLRDKNTPKGLAFGHGGIAGMGILLLIIYALLYSPAPLISLVLFVVAALGGFYMVMRDILGWAPPKWLALGHGLIAVCAFLLLGWFFYAYTIL